MNRFIGFVIKEFYHIARDPRTLAILFGMPIMQMLLFGFVITNEIKDAPIAILDQSRDPVTLKLTQKIVSSGYFILDSYLHSPLEIDDVFKQGRVKMVMLFESGFADKLKKEGVAHCQILADASEPNTAELLVNYSQGIIQDFMREENSMLNAPVRISTETRMLYNPGLKGVFMFVPGIIALLLTLISALMTSISITREKELGTMEVLLVSPLRPFLIIAGKVTPYVLLSFIDACIILLVGRFVFGVPVLGSYALLLAEMILYIVTALSVGILISTLTSSQQVAMMASMVGLMLPTILLSGFIFPIENMPWILQALCQVMPPRWFITILKDIMLKGNGFLFIWKETMVLIVMTAMFLAISVKKFKIRLQ